MNSQKHSTIPRSGYDTSLVWNFCTCSSAGEHPGFFFGVGAPLRNGVTKNTNMKKKAFVQAISYCELLTIHINTADYSAKPTFLQPLILQPRLMFYFNTNTLQIFFFICRILVVLLERVPTPCTLPLDLPRLRHHFTGQPVVAS